MQMNNGEVLVSPDIFPTISIRDPSNSVGIIYKPIVMRVHVSTVDKNFNILLF